MTKTGLPKTKLANSSLTTRALYHLAVVEPSELDLNPPYQRGDVWTIEQQRNLIRSFISGIPVPAIILNDRHAVEFRDFDGGLDTRYGVIDGKQRIIAIMKWFSGELDVPAVWFSEDMLPPKTKITEDTMVTHDQLSRPGQLICATDFTIAVAEGQMTDMAQEAEVFSLVNRAGTAMTMGDLERAYRVQESGASVAEYQELA